jgi:outer membrane protein OmpA-like peptidoglycan-associated protein
MTNKKLVIIFALSILFNCANAQVITLSNANKRTKEFYQQIDNDIAMGKTDAAAIGLNSLLSEQPKFVDGWWLMARLYFENLKKYDSAIIAFDKVKELKPNFTPTLDFMRGQAYMYSGKYAEAKKIFLEARNGSADDKIKKDIENSIRSCDFAQKSMQSPKKFNPINLGPGVNSAAEELMPSVTADERFLFYTRHESFGRYTDENIYVSENKNGQFQRAQLVDRPISTDEFLEGAPCIAPGGKYLFFTSCGRQDALGGCDNYYTKRVPGGWDRPKNMGKNINTPGWDIQPFISADGRTVYFAARRQGGYGGLDIWMSTLGDDFQWGPAVNLGPKINTEKDEERPFIHPDDKTLYFSSDGHPGFGSSDFFYSSRDIDGNWSEPVDLGFPINTPGDEIGLVITTDGNTAYMGSERFGGMGGMDIYKFEMDESIKPQHVTYFKGHVYDESTGKPIKTNILLYDLDNSGKQFGSLTSDQTNGEFLATIPYGRDYACQITKEGYLFYSANFTLKKFTINKPYEMDIYLKKIEVGKTVVLNNIFFEVNKFDLRASSNAELNNLVELMNKNPTLKIEVSGHTDKSGAEADNKVLSEKRAKSVVDYLVSKNIDASRLSYKGYGASKPISDNTTDEGKAQNRRTEFLVTGI